MDINNGIVRDFREISALIPPRPRKQWLVVGVWNSEFDGRKYVIEMCERPLRFRVPLSDRIGEECMFFSCCMITVVFSYTLFRRSLFSAVNSLREIDSTIESDCVR